MDQRVAGTHGVMVVVILVMALGLLPARAEERQAEERWYSPAQVAQGQGIYAEHCAACHGASGEGQPNWEQRDPNTGYYPAPPLDASGHAAEHPLDNMRRTLIQGGAALGGTMPSFIDVLDQAQMEAVLAYVQSLWPDELYVRWQDIDAGRAAASAGGHRH